MCSYVRVSVCICLLSINVTDQSNAAIATCTTQYRVLTKFQEFISWKFKKSLSRHL